jgi:adenylate cyclase class 2
VGGNETGAIVAAVVKYWEPDPRPDGAAREARPVPTTNIEIKARCADLAAAREGARRLGAAHVGLDRQVDTYFRTRVGRLKLRESCLSGGQLIPYLRPDREGPKRSDYQVVPLSDAVGVKRIMSEILGVHRVVTKEREIFLYENVRIHLDRVDGLGDFLELEAIVDGTASAEAEARRKVARLMEELGVREDDLVALSYEGLLGEGGPG